MSKPITRVLAVLELLQAHGHMSGIEIAQRLGIDSRTLRRYIVQLGEMGIPILSERGRFGGYSLLPGFKLPPMMFTDDESLALCVGLLAARQLGLAESVPAAASAQAKIERILPPRLQARMRALGDMVHLGLALAAPLPDNDALLVLSAAALARQRVHLRYCSLLGDASARDVDPYGLAFHGGSWYLLALCHLRGAMRSFRLDRVQGTAALPASFQPPAGFDPLFELRKSLAAIPRAHQVEVLLHTTLHQAATLFPETPGWFEQTPDGVLLRMETDHVDWLAGKLAGSPCVFEVLQPDELRHQLAALGEKLLAIANTSRLSQVD